MLREAVKSRKILIGIVIFIALIFAGPWIIEKIYNESEVFWFWDKQDILSYYGMIVTAILGILSVYLTVYISNKNYREDARSRILPYIAITVINLRSDLPSLGLVARDDNFIESIDNRLFFVIDGKDKIRVTESLHASENEKLVKTDVLWKRGKDGKMYLRDANYVSMPFYIENIGNGVAKKLHIGLSYYNNKPFFKTEIILKQNESFFLHIFSEKSFDVIKGKYRLIIRYEDIMGYRYEQIFPVEIFEKGGNKYKNLDTNGVPRLYGKSKIVYSDCSIES